MQYLTRTLFINIILNHQGYDKSGATFKYSVLNKNTDAFVLGCCSKSILDVVSLASTEPQACSDYAVWLTSTQNKQNHELHAYFDKVH